MKRTGFRFTAALALVAAAGLAAAEGAGGAAIVLDATDLTLQDLAVDSVNLPPNDVPATLFLDPGPHLLNDKTGVRLRFDLTPAGLLDYDPALDGVFSGRGTTTLTLTGKPLHMDATAMTPQELVFNGFAGFHGDRVFTYRLLPGGSPLLLSKTGTRIQPTFSLDGTVDYPSSLDGVLAGRGTSTLVMLGVPVTLDLTGYTGPKVNVNGLGEVPDGEVVTFRALPGTGFQLVGPWTSPFFTVDESGRISNLPAVLNGYHLSGNGTGTLVLRDPDDAPPVVSLSADPGSLWPADHGMVEVAVTASAADDLDPAPAAVLVVTSDQPDDARGGGDGSTTGDIEVRLAGGGVLRSSGDSPRIEVALSAFAGLSLRAEREGSRKEGRTYRLSLTAVDASGNASGEAVAEVRVPHDGGK